MGLRARPHHPFSYQRRFWYYQYRRSGLCKRLAGLMVLLFIFNWIFWKLEQYAFDLGICDETWKQGLPGSWRKHAVHTIPLKLKRGNASGLPCVPVVVWPLIEHGLDNSEGRHLEINGIEESPYLQMSTDLHDFDPHVIWIGDAATHFTPSVWCRTFHRHVVTAQNERAKRGLPLQWPIFIVDYRDTEKRDRCRCVERAVGMEFVHYSKRSIVTGREWSNKTKWINSGTLLDNDEQFHHTPYFIRTDLVHTINDVLANRGLALKDLIEKVDRAVDVSHFWPVIAETNDNSELRTAVSTFLHNLKQTSQWNIVVGLFGSAREEGRQGVDIAYVEALLKSKIVVVTQRDQWEDHYRLMEALASGAMVLTDRMLSKPHDITNGTALVEFTSLADLQHKIGYYLQHENERLAIARRGWLTSMTRHRSWHRIEDIIFGQSITTCTKNSNCPFVVHASD